MRRVHEIDSCGDPYDIGTGNRAQDGRDACFYRARIPATSRNCSGETRIAAPVGHARTQAAPPSMSLHMSHFTAFFASDLSCDFVSTPGSSPNPVNSHFNSDGRSRFGSSGPIWITP